MRALVVIAVVLGGAGSVSADARFTEDARVRYVEQALAALRSADPATRAALSEEVHLGARTTCKAAASDPPVRCLLDVVRKVCAAKPEDRRTGCQVMADVIVTNLLGEKEVVPSKVRFKLMNEADGYRAAMNRHLLGRYAILVARLTLFPGFDQDKGLAPTIDKFCRQHILRRGTTWGRCVSAIVWYIGTSHKASHEGG